MKNQLLPILRSVAPIVVSLFLMWALVACSAESRTMSTTNTLGQEFIDLKKAFESGALSQAEYDEVREALRESAENR